MILCLAGLVEHRRVTDTVSDTGRQHKYRAVRAREVKIHELKCADGTHLQTRYWSLQRSQRCRFLAHVEPTRRRMQLNWRCMSKVGLAALTADCPLCRDVTVGTCNI